MFIYDFVKEALVHPAESLLLLRVFESSLKEQGIFYQICV